MSPTRSLAWSIWQRNGHSLKFIGGIFLVADFYFRFLRASEAFVPVILSLLVVFSYLGLMAIFMYQDSDVGVRGSTYPSRMFALPVKTSQLVFTPLALGSATFLGSGLILSAAISRAEHSFPLFFPAFFMTALYVMLTAIFWFPLGIRYSKLIATLVCAPALGAAVGFAFEKYYATELAVCSGLAIFIVFCYLVAYLGVVRARRGDEKLIWWKTVERQESKKDVRWLNFRSTVRAQRWYEWRQQGFILPSLVLFMGIIFFMPMLWPSNMPSNEYSVVKDFGFGSQPTIPMVPPYIATYLPAFMVLVPFAAWIVGCGARRTEIRNSDRTFMLFFGTRPISDQDLVMPKFWAALKSTLVAWGIVLVLLMIVSLINGGLHDRDKQIILDSHVPIYRLLWTHMSWIGAYYMAVALALLVALTFRNYVIGFWMEMSGKVWLRYVYAIVLLALIFGIPAELNKRGPSQQYMVGIYVGMTLALWTIHLVRASIAGYLVRKQLQSGVLTRKALGRGVTTYLLIIGIVLGTALSLTGTLREAVVNEKILSSWMAIMWVSGYFVLWVPFVRILLATELLHQNRHRAN